MHDRVIFMGTPDFAVPALRTLVRRADRESLLVVTQPDRPVGRGRRLQAPPVKFAAEDAGMSVLQVETMKDPEVRGRLEEFAPDLIVVAAFGRILPRWVLNLPRRGCVNLHASLLPRFRGASPIAAAIACGDRQAGIALMQMEAGLDTGPVFASVEIDIDPDDTTDTLTQRLAEAGAGLLDEHLGGLLDGSLEPQPQRGEVVETRKILKAHGAIDWTLSARDIERHVRAMWPWPRAWFETPGGLRVQLHAAEAAESGHDGAAGAIVAHDERGIIVATGDGSLRILKAQLPGKQPQGPDALRQHPDLSVGSTLGPGRDVDWPDPWIVDAGQA